VYDGPGTERGETLNPAALGSLSPEAWSELRLVVAPCFRLHQFGHPVHEYWSARKDGGEPAPSAPRSIKLAINRRDYVVEKRELADAEFVLLEEITRGASLADAIAAAMESAADATLVESQIGGWFARWSSDGYFCTFTNHSD
jgi:hypothetical protein